jgi:hypothetical protein
MARSIFLILLLLAVFAPGALLAPDPEPRAAGNPLSAARLTGETRNVRIFPDHERAALSVPALRQLVRDGRTLFETEFNLLDGAGRPAATGDSKPTVRARSHDMGLIRTSGPDALSCIACHNKPVVGGAGDFVANVFVGAQFRDPPTTSIATQDTSERNTLGLFGSGAIEMLAREMTQELQGQRAQGLRMAQRLRRLVRVPLRAKGVAFGQLTARPDGTYDAREIKGVDADLVIKPFGVKGVVISLREFTVNALNHHHGIQAIERFGWERTGMRDFDEDGVELEFSIGQVSAVTLFQASLPAPRSRSPQSPPEQQRVSRGESLFRKTGCASCHIPVLPLRSSHFVEPNPFNRPGNLLPTDVRRSLRLPLPTSSHRSGVYRASDGSRWVAAYTDLKRHRIADARDPFFGNERLRQDNVPTDQFLTSKLWDLATSGPYGHRGDCSTISEVILHHAGEATAARNGFGALSAVDKRVLIDFLKLLGAAKAGYVVSP